MPRPIVVCGATGRVGSLVVSELRARGLPVRAVGRPSVRLAALATIGVDIRGGDTTDPTFMEEAFRDASAVFLMTPVDTGAEDVNAVQFAVIDAAATALERSTTRHAVLLSSWGAELEQRVGGIIACHRFEAALGAIPGLDVVHLRPVWFMDNFLWAIPLVRMAGINGSAIDGTVSFPMIATRDIAPVATSLLAEPTFVGSSVRYLYGPRAYSLVEVTKAIGEVIGKPDLRYVCMPEQIYRRGLLGAGLTPNAAELALEIMRGIEAGVVSAEPFDPRRATPTSIEQFAEEIFSPRYRDSERPGFGARVGGTLLRTYLSVAGHRAERRQARA